MGHGFAGELDSVGAILQSELLHGLAPQGMHGPGHELVYPGVEIPRALVVFLLPGLVRLGEQSRSLGASGLELSPCDGPVALAGTGWSLLFCILTCPLVLFRAIQTAAGF